MLETGVTNELFDLFYGNILLPNNENISMLVVNVLTFALMEAINKQI